MDDSVLKNVGYASSVPEFVGNEHVENVLHVLVQQAAKTDIRQEYEVIGTGNAPD